MLPRVRALVSAMVIFVPEARAVPKSFVALPSVIFPAVPEPDETKLAVPLMIRLPGPLCAIEFPEINVRLVRLMEAVLMIEPAELLPMVSRLAVMLPSSVDIRPKLPVDFVPRSTTDPDVGIRRTEPDEVALIVLVIVKFWAVI